MSVAKSKSSFRGGTEKKLVVPEGIAVALMTGRAEVISLWANHVRAENNGELSKETIGQLIDSLEHVADLLFTERRARRYAERRMADMADNLKGALKLAEHIPEEVQAVAEEGVDPEDARVVVKDRYAGQED